MLRQLQKIKWSSKMIQNPHQKHSRWFEFFDGAGPEVAKKKKDKTALENHMKLKGCFRTTLKAFLMILNLYIFYGVGWQDGKKKIPKAKNMPILPQKNVKPAFAKAWIEMCCCKYFFAWRLPSKKIKASHIHLPMWLYKPEIKDFSPHCKVPFEYRQ